MQIDIVVGLFWAYNITITDEKMKYEKDKKKEKQVAANMETIVWLHRTYKYTKNQTNGYCTFHLDKSKQ